MGKQVIGDKLYIRAVLWTKPVRHQDRSVEIFGGTPHAGGTHFDQHSQGEFAHADGNATLDAQVSSRRGDATHATAAFRPRSRLDGRDTVQKRGSLPHRQAEVLLQQFSGCGDHGNNHAHTAKIESQRAAETAKESKSSERSVRAMGEPFDKVGGVEVAEEIVLCGVTGAHPAALTLADCKATLTLRPPKLVKPG